MSAAAPAIDHPSRFLRFFKVGDTKRTSFINTVTAERVKWITKVRENVATLCAPCDQWIYHKTQDSTSELQKQIETKKIEIRLQLNPNDPEDNEITRLLDRLPSWTQSATPAEYRALQAELVQATQAMLKREWDKVKNEAVEGDLRHRNSA
ncbi:MAG: hypothetical protein M3481_11350 [Actinomycetota bacterium]|nr:hypothetical protein [Actinomycetota bacterium]